MGTPVLGDVRRGLSVRELAFHVNDLGGAIVVFRLCLDESAHGGVFAVGGYIAHLEQWERFEQEWRTALSEAGVSTFHATDFFSFRGEFVGWNHDIRRHVKFAKRFTAIAEKQTEVGVGRAVDIGAFNAIAAGPLAAAAITPHDRFTPLMFCARTCLEWICYGYAKQLEHLPIEVIFEEGDGVGEVIDYCYMLKKRLVPWAMRFETFSTAPKEFLPLQAADLIVHEARRRVQEVLHPTGRGLRKAMARLVATQRVDLRVWSEKEMSDELDRVLRAVRAEMAGIESRQQKPKNLSLVPRCLRRWLRRRRERSA